MTEVTATTGDDRWNDYTLSQQRCIAIGHLYNLAADFMPKHQGKWMVGLYAIIEITQVCVTHTAACDFHRHLAWFRCGKLESFFLQQCAGLLH